MITNSNLWSPIWKFLSKFFDKFSSYRKVLQIIMIDSYVFEDALSIEKKILRFTWFLIKKSFFPHVFANWIIILAAAIERTEKISKNTIFSFSINFRVSKKNGCLDLNGSLCSAVCNFTLFLRTLLVLCVRPFYPYVNH